MGLAKELGKFPHELEETLDAADIMEWVAYFHLQDPEYKSKIEDQLSDEASLHEKANAVRSFFNNLGKRKR